MAARINLELDTMQGANLAGHIRVGCPQDFASILPSVLSHFASLYPRMHAELHIEGNAALVDSIKRRRAFLEGRSPAGRLHPNHHPATGEVALPENTEGLRSH
jgi:DNA-binding transcriptional LysR family regulator